MGTLYSVFLFVTKGVNDWHGPAAWTVPRGATQTQATERCLSGDHASDHPKVQLRTRGNSRAWEGRAEKLKTRKRAPNDGLSELELFPIFSFSSDREAVKTTPIVRGNTHAKKTQNTGMARSIIEYDGLIGTFSSSNAKLPEQVGYQQSYVEVLAKLIPCEVLAFYLPAVSLLKVSTTIAHWVWWVVFSVGIVLTLIFSTLIQLSEIKDGRKTDPFRPLHIILSGIAFFLWAIQMGEPFSNVPGFEPNGRVLSAIAGMAFTLVAPKFIHYRSN